MSTITREECRTWITENSTSVRLVAEQGYVKEGRGCVIIHFKTKPALVAELIYMSSDLVKTTLEGSDHAFHTDIIEKVRTYEPDYQAVFLVMLDMKFYSRGVVQFKY